MASLEPRYYKVSQAKRLGEVLQNKVKEQLTLPKHVLVRQNKVEAAKLS